MRASVIVPAFNAESSIGECLDALIDQTIGRAEYEIIVVDDGSNDSTPDIVGRYKGVRLVKQQNSGPAAARNNGAGIAVAPIIVFTDSDCSPQRDWLENMIAPLEADQKIVAAKGAYRTRQRELAARFVQLEYQDKYRILTRDEYIDFIDTYSAAFRKDVFLTFGGYDTSFKVACAEDVELSYRMGNAGHKMIFNPKAIVFHRHPDNFIAYFRKKYKFAYWRMLAVRKNPNKMVSDSHTPQIMKFQLLLAPLAIVLAALAVFIPIFRFWAWAVLLMFILLSLPMTIRILRRDTFLGLLTPAALFGRAVAQFMGVVNGLFQWYVICK